MDLASQFEETRLEHEDFGISFYHNHFHFEEDWIFNLPFFNNQNSFD